MKQLTTEQRHAHIDKHVMRGYKAHYIDWCLMMELDLDDQRNQLRYYSAFNGEGVVGDFCRHGIKS